jgi:hypothetical protein
MIVLIKIKTGVRFAVENLNTLPLFNGSSTAFSRADRFIV